MTPRNHQSRWNARNYPPESPEDRARRWASPAAAMAAALDAMASPPRCRSYRRASGVFVYRGVRCELAAGHAGKHDAPGRWLDPHARHRWGRPMA